MPSYSDTKLIFLIFLQTWIFISNLLAKVWKSNRTSAAVYPSVAKEGLLWFWPDTRPEFKNIADSQPPPSIPALADPSFKDELASRDLAYGLTFQSFVCVT